MFVTNRLPTSSFPFSFSFSSSSSKKDLLTCQFQDSEEEKEVFRKDPEKLVAHVRHVEASFNERWDHNIVGTPQQVALKDTVIKRMREHIKDDKLLEHMTPAFPVNCRR